jgi:ABC-2 type transport system permease protein
MTHVISAELFKLRTTRTFLVMFGIALALVLVPAVLIVSLVDFASESDLPYEILVFILGPPLRAFALILGVLAITNEFRHGTITPALLVVPNRIRFVLGKFVAVLLMGLALGLVGTALMVIPGLAISAARDFDFGEGAGSLLLGGTIATGLNAALGLAVGAIVRNQVGAIVGVLVYGFMLEDLIGLIPGIRDFLPEYGLGGVSQAIALSDVNSDTDLLGQLPASLLLALYVAVFLAAGLVLMRRRDVTA